MAAVNENRIALPFAFAFAALLQFKICSNFNCSYMALSSSTFLPFFSSNLYQLGIL
jgi:hypothetical protein